MKFKVHALIGVGLVGLTFFWLCARGHHLPHADSLQRPTPASVWSAAAARLQDVESANGRVASEKGSSPSKVSLRQFIASKVKSPPAGNSPEPTVVNSTLRELGRIPDVCTSQLPGISLDAMANAYSEAVRGQMPTDDSSAAEDVGAVRDYGADRNNGAHIQNVISATPDEKGAQSAVENPSGNVARPLLETVETEDANTGTPVSFDQFNPHAKTTQAGIDVSHSRAADRNTPLADALSPDPHAEVFAQTPYPSATKCAQCHQQIFDEWASSSHAYAAISPMFHRFEDTINKLTQGTIGYFCMRCHAPVATTMGLRRDQAIWDGPRVFREGVTCVACHRVKENYTKANGERRIEPGDIHEPVYSGAGQLGSQIVTKYKDYFKVKTDPHDRGPGLPMHRRAIQFEQLSQSDFCMSCHQVAVQPGIKLEVVWDQYRASPAHREGTTCQDCHMGIVPGRAEGYAIGPAAVVNNKVVTPERKHSNHTFYGPGYSIAHPGIFPDSVASDRWSINQWLQFDWRGGWGTEAFEDAVADGRLNVPFPPPWQEPDDRYDAREIVDANLKKLLYKKDLRRQVLENGSRIDGPFFARSPVVGQPLRFHYCVTNLNSGHNMPSGSLGAQPQLWLNVALIDPEGRRVWESGYLDSQGDLADAHSQDVLQRRLPLDKQLFNLQTKFLVTNVKGTDREAYLPISFEVDQLPFIRPAKEPVSVINHPPFIRMEGHSIAPLGSRKAKYVVPAACIQQPGTYRLSVRMRSRAEPIYFMRFVGATPEMQRMMNEWIVDVHVGTVVFEVR